MYTPRTRWANYSNVQYVYVCMYVCIRGTGRLRFFHPFVLSFLYLSSLVRALFTSPFGLTFNCACNEIPCRYLPYLLNRQGMTGLYFRADIRRKFTVDTVGISIPAMNTLRPNSSRGIVQMFLWRQTKNWGTINRECIRAYVVFHTIGFIHWKDSCSAK